MLIPRGKSIACCEDRIAASSSSRDGNNHDSLGANQEQAPEAHASTYYTGSSSAICQAGVPSPQDPFTRKYEV